MESATETPSFDQFRTLDLRGRSLGAAELRAVMPRAEARAESSEEAVAHIIGQVRTHGLEALRGYARQFDGASVDHPRVPASVLASALENLDPAVRSALGEAIARARRFAAAQVPADVELSMGAGATLRHKWVPVDRVGLYVPGGLAVYPSSVVMNVVPAQAAGVRSLALASPPQKDNDGWPHPVILAAAAMLGIDEVYAMGGAQAVAALAYGVGPDASGAGIDPVNVVTGPGNVFVATAKRLVQSVVGIDSEAGTTEIAILADSTARADFVAADLISQAEHDPQAASVLITDSVDLAAAVRRELSQQIELTRHRERVRAALSGPQSATVLVDGMEHGIVVCNAYAAEHLEIHTADARGVADRILNAGAVFIGDYSPVSLGDYCAGSNHVLPTGGTAAFSSGLNVTTFLRAMQLVDYDREALREVGGHISALSAAEDLPAHGDAVSIRFATTAADHKM